MNRTTPTEVKVGIGLFAVGVGATIWMWDWRFAATGVLAFIVAAMIAPNDRRS